MVVKVKAHCNSNDIDVIIRWQDFAGNAFADKLADLAADMAAVPSHLVSAFKAIDATCWKVQSRISSIIFAASNRDADDREARSHKIDKASRQRETCAMEAEDLLGSERRCEELGIPPPPEPFDSELPLPEPGILKLGGPRAKAVHVSHRLAFKRGIVWCTKCGGHGTTRGRKLLKPCVNLTATGIEVLRRVRRGLTPHNSVDWLDEMLI